MDAIAPALGAALAIHAMSTPLRTAHFLAQTCQESSEFSRTEEADDGSQYEGRLDLGNIHPGDGPRFKGRGLIRLTGRSTYQHYSNPPRLDLLADPDLAADPVTSLDLAGRLWTDRSVNELADLDDFVAVSFLVNGGFEGLDARRDRLARAKRVLGISHLPRPSLPVLREGNQGAAVRCLQARLRKLDGRTEVDGNFGPGTGQALRQFQSATGLAPDGTVGPQVWDALEQATGH